MKVLLISANTFIEPYPVYPLGLDYVTGAIEKDHTVLIADLNLEKTKADLPRLLADEAPDVIGISIRNIDNTDKTDPKGFIHRYQDLTATIRAHSLAPIVLGGSGFSIFPSEIMALLDADYGIAGEGEQLAELLKMIEKKIYPDRATRTSVAAQTIPGLFVRGESGTGNPGKSHTMKQQFPRAFSPQSPHLNFYLTRGGMLNLQTKRGCPFACVYCTYPLIEGRKMRRFDPQEVADTALTLEKAGARYLFITDSAFNADIDHSLAVARAFQKRGVSIPWGAYFAPVTLPDGYFETLKQAGLAHIEFGTESLCDSVLKAYGKTFSQAQAVQTHQAAVQAGVHVAHFILMGGPGETPVTLDQTLERLTTLKKTAIFFYLGMRIYPGTPLYDLAIGSGQINEHQSLLDPVFYHSPAIETALIMEKVQAMAKDRTNWVVGTGGDATSRILNAMYKKGLSGPLWEFLIR
ncbi:B12-binding domain-containing radical SAM protein [Desulfobacter hydrogenophilus]|uniref:Radical SAM protein n=1 Tax=Desulfobacter hydrogenophilus TaxID=2291 RepID=A0A328FE00_9BACT|nr:radical SAM protein [Desulfobacter hydrogenophilus]NDY72603.1 radical SAM protein [Desulfobacter hydrogenophilus]QBH13323.1 radical SAM protein [Desulfobacter hydrogenophilus]RAM01277.1 B12-binding domain-containing radical SAM protein [Desulfobacter hydrogenophilus]